MRVLPACILVATAGCLTVSPAAAALDATGPSAIPAAVAQQKMTIVDFEFAKPKAQLNVGDTMTWTNNDRAPHDVSTTKAPVKLQSPLLAKGQSWKHTFKVAGVYDYVCSIHPEMKAVVNVAAAKSAAKPSAKKPRKQIATVEPDATGPELTAAPTADETQNSALTANARRLESVRQWGAALVGVALVSLLIVGTHGGSVRADTPRPEWAGGVGVSPSRHVRRPPKS